jgi:hypothetical protein
MKHDLIEIDGFLKIENNEYPDDNIVQPFKGRTIDTTKHIDVYRNLNRKGKVYSIKQGNKVVAHATALCMIDAEFKVNKSGKNRSLETKTRNIHAYIRGYYSTHGMGLTANNNLPYVITYNPFEDRGFYLKHDDVLDVSDAKFLIINSNGVQGCNAQTKLI